MQWICVAPEVICLCPSPSEMVKSGMVDVTELVKNGIASIDEVAEAALNYASKNINELKDEIGDTVDSLADVPGDLFDRYLQPVIDKLLEWMKFIFEKILDGANAILGGISNVVYDVSLLIYKAIFRVCLGADEIKNLAMDVLNYLLELLGTNFEEVETYIENTEPFKTVLPLFKTLKEILDKIESIVTSPERLLEYLVDEYIRPFIVDYFEGLLPLEKIPLPGIEDLILNIAVDNVFNVKQLFGDATASLRKSMERIVKFLITLVGNEALQEENNPDADVPSWRFDILALILTLEGIVAGFITFHPDFPAATSGLPGQVGTALTVIGVYLGYLNIINSVMNTASSGKFDEGLTEHLNGIKRSKDLAITNSTAMVITIAGLITQIKGGASPYEYIVTALSFLVCLGGFACALGSNNISSEPILVALAELYDDLDYGEEEKKNPAEEARNNEVIPDEPEINEYYKDYGSISIIRATPIVRVTKPWYGPEIINYCFVDPNYARTVAEDFIDENDNIKGMWLSTKVKNESIAKTRVNVKFYYSINGGTYQLIHDATQDKENGDILEPRETKEIWFQNWNISKSLAQDILEGKCEVIVKVSINGDYDSNKSQLENSTRIKISPHLKINPIELSSSGELRTKSFNNSSVPLVREGDIITLSSKVKNTGGSFVNYRNLCVRWYLDDREGKSQLISKQFYTSSNNINYYDETMVSLTLDTTNLGLSTYGIEGWIRNVKLAILEKDFEKLIGENIPLFTERQEQSLSITFDSWPPKIVKPKLSVDKSIAVEGETILVGSKIENTGNGPLNLRSGEFIFKELNEDKDEQNIEKIEIKLLESNFETTPFENGITESYTESEKISFQFIPPSDMWIDSIELPSNPGSSDNVKCSEVNISYLGYKISEFSEYDNNQGIHYLQNPVLLKESETYFFEFAGISGEVLIEKGRYLLAGRDVIKNSVITNKNGGVLYFHPKIKLHCFKSLPPNSYGYFEYIMDTTEKTDIKYIQWEFNSDNLDVYVSNQKAIKIEKREIKAFKFKAKKTLESLGYERVAEFPVEIIKEDDVNNIQVKISSNLIKSQAGNYTIFMKESLTGSAIPLANQIFSLSDEKPKSFIIGIAASRNIVKGTSLNFSIIGTASVEEKEIKKELNLTINVAKDYSEIFMLKCEDPHHELERSYETQYVVSVINNINKKIELDIKSTGQSETLKNNWDYFFSSKNKKEQKLELTGRREDLLFNVKSNQKAKSFEVTNIISAKYNWNPLESNNSKFILKKDLTLLTSFKEKAHPLGVTFRSSPNAGDPGIVLKLMAQFNIFPSADQEVYNIILDIDGNVELISRPPNSFKLTRGDNRKITWEIKIPEDAMIGNKIPIKLISGVAEDPRKITNFININITNNRKDYQFALERDWRILSVVQGKKATIKVTIENIGRKYDTITISAAHTLPRGWWIYPKRKKISLTPDNRRSYKINVNSPRTAKLSDSGIITLTAVSKGNPLLKQSERITIKSAPPGANWSVLLRTSRTKKLISSKGDTSFNLTVINNGNRPLGIVNLSIKHKYNPIQFKTTLIPNQLNLRKTGSIRNAKAIIEPRLTGPGDYKFEIIARWEERILYAQDSKQVEIEYSQNSFFKTKYGLLTIGLGAGIVIIAIVLIYFISNF